MRTTYSFLYSHSFSLPRNSYRHHLSLCPQQQAPNGSAAGPGAGVAGNGSDDERGLKSKHVSGHTVSSSSGSNLLVHPFYDMICK